MAKKGKTKANKRTSGARKPAPTAKSRRPAASAAAKSKYDQPGAPWWKQVKGPQRKST